MEAKIDSRLPTAPSCQVGLDRTALVGRKRNISEAFDSKEIEGEAKERHEFEMDKTQQSTVKCSDVSHQPVFKDYNSSDISPTYFDFFSAGKRVRFNLPKFIVPGVLPKNDEKAMFDLRVLLKEHGFEVYDRPTLAFFAI